MQQYPTYYPNQISMNQPNMYPNNNFVTPNYMDRITQLQQYQQNLQPQMQQLPVGLNCRIVDDFSMITANDVPMDGNGAVFMKRDCSEMQWRNWSANGTIQTTVYFPVQPENQVEGTNMPQMDFNALNEDVRALREDIIARLDAIEKSVSKPAPKRLKKEAETDE